MNKSIHIKIINKSRDFLIKTNITEKELVDKLEISENLLRSIYKKYLGVTPSQYRKIVRMKKVKTLLRITEMGVTQIASCVGYANMSKMSVRFRLEYGYSPSEYRKELRRVS